MVTASKKPAQSKTSSKSAGKNKSPMPIGLKIGLIVGVVVLVCVIGMGIIGLIFAGSVFNYFSQNGNIKIDEKSGTVEISSGDGKQTFSTKSDLPENYPSDIPIYPNSTVTFSAANTDAGNSVTWQSSESRDKVVEYFESKLSEQGWSKQAGQGSYFVAGIGYAEKSSCTLSYVVSEEVKDGKAQTTIVAVEKNEPQQ